MESDNTTRTKDISLGFQGLDSPRTGAKPVTAEKM